jgi:hypothetical protein
LFISCSSFIFNRINGSEQQLKEILKDQSIDNARKVYKDFESLMNDFNEKINGGQHAML